RGVRIGIAAAAMAVKDDLAHCCYSGDSGDVGVSVGSRAALAPCSAAVDAVSEIACRDLTGRGRSAGYQTSARGAPNAPRERNVVVDVEGGSLCRACRDRTETRPPKSGGSGSIGVHLNIKSGFLAHNTDSDTFV